MNKFIQKLTLIFICTLLFFHTTEAKAQDSFNNDEMICLSTALYFEARGEGYVGLRAVGHAIIKRSHNRDLTICQTITEPSRNSNYRACAFSFYCDNKPEIITDIEAWNLSKTIAFRLLDGQYPFSSVGEADHYLRCDIRHKIWWAKRMQMTARVQSHCFFDSKKRR